MAKPSKKKQVLEELEQMPNASSVCQKVGISRQTFYRWRKQDDKFDQKVNEALEMGDLHICDIAENQLMKKIQQGDWAPTKYLLDRRHPKYSDNKRERIYPRKPEKPYEEDMDYEHLAAQEAAFALLEYDDAIQGKMFDVDN